MGRRRPSCGQSLSEYSLVIGLVVVSCVVGAATLNNNLNVSLSQSIQMPAGPSVDPALTAQNLANPRDLIAANEIGANPMGAIGQADWAVDATVSVGQAQMSVADAIETIGTDGTTHEFANSLAEILSKPDVQAKLTAEEIALFDRLSNQGHRLAEIQTLIKQATQSVKGNGDKLKNKKVKFEGKPYLIQDMALAIGFSPGPDNNGVANVPFSKVALQTRQELKSILGHSENQYMSKDIYKFIAEYTKVQKILGTKIPELKPAVTNLSRSLLKVNNTFATEIWVKASNGIPIKNPDKLVADKLTNDKSAQTCSMDGNKTTDTGTQCVVK